MSNKKIHAKKHHVCKKQEGGFNPLSFLNLSSLGLGYKPSDEFDKNAVGTQIGSVANTALNFVPGAGPILSQIGAGNMLGDMINGLTNQTKAQDNTVVNDYLKGKTNTLKPAYQTGGNLVPQYEAENKEIVIKKPGEYINMFGSGKLKNESSFAGVIDGDQHEEDTDNDGQTGELMSGGEYILSDKKTLFFKDADKHNKSVAKLEEPIVKKIQELEESKDRYKLNTVPFFVDKLHEIKDTYEHHKTKDELAEAITEYMNLDPRIKEKIIKGVELGELSLDDLNSVVGELGIDMDQFKKRHGGHVIEIKKENEGKFTSYAKNKGMGVQEAAHWVLQHSNNPTLRKRANFAINATKFKH